MRTSKIKQEKKHSLGEDGTQYCNITLSNNLATAIKKKQF